MKVSIQNVIDRASQLSSILFKCNSPVMTPVSLKTFAGLSAHSIYVSS